MSRSSFAHMRCSVARTLDLVGEWWTLLIIREAFFGTRRFNEFQQQLGIAPNVLTQRLARLVEGGVLDITATSASGKALEYRLTPRGRELYPVIVALAQWGDRHVPAPEGPPVRIVDARDGQPVAPLQVHAADGRPLQAHDAQVVPGPGASADERARMTELNERRQRRKAQRA